MQSTRELVREHNAIRGLLRRFERLLDEAERTVSVDAEPILRLLSFFEREVDELHQVKEEEILLRRLHARAARADLARVEEVRAEHAEGRRLLEAMRASVEGACYGDAGCIADLVRASRAYLAGQAHHADWEEGVLFDLARRVLDPDEDARVVRAFRALEARRGTSVRASARRLARWLDGESSLLAA